MARKSKNVYRKYDECALKQAVNAVKGGVLSLRQASNQFGIPKSTLSDRVSGKIEMGAKPGRPPVVPREIEAKVIDHVTKAANCGFGITRRELLVKTGRLCQKMGIKTPFKNGVPGKAYFQGLKVRHPEVVIRKPEKLGTSRARMLNPTVVNNYVNDLGSIIQTLNLGDKPAQI